MCRKVLCTIILVVFALNLFANTRAAGNVIVKFHEATGRASINEFVENFAHFQMSEMEVLSPRFNIYLFSFNESRVSEDLFLDTIRSDSRVHLAQFNHWIERTEFIPNDPLFRHQWHLRNTGQPVPPDYLTGFRGSDIKATYAWEHVYANQNRNQREIVIAVVDGGFDLYHPDINWDHRGWNTLTMPHSSNIPNGSHGTHVSGIIGAFGNNEIGVAGIAWDVKIMPIHAIPGYESNIVAAFNYVIENRIRYNESGGEEGVFIVASNSSFGADGVKPADWPIMGEMYNIMGRVGILSSVAAGNNNHDVDLFGNSPVSYPSPYMIGVASTTNRDAMSSFSAYGAINIHLGAPGSNVFSTWPSNTSNGYHPASGTSMAAPMVTGVIGLMYSAASEEMLAYYDDKPELLPLIFKQYILDGVDPIPALQGRTATGGRLNALNPVLSVLEHTPRNITAMPQISPTTNFFTEPITVTLTSETPGASI